MAQEIAHAHEEVIPAAVSASKDVAHMASEHTALLIAVVVILGIVAIAIVWRQYNKIIDRLEKLDHPQDGYIRIEACRDFRKDCGGHNKQCQEKIMAILERLERKVERNAGMMFYLADILVEKEIISGKDLTGLRERLMKDMQL